MANSSQLSTNCQLLIAKYSSYCFSVLSGAGEQAVGGAGLGGQADILLDDQPALTPGCLEAIVDGREIDLALAELGEDAACDGFREARVLSAYLVQGRLPEVFQMQVGDPRGVCARHVDRICAAEGKMAGVEAEADLSRLGDGTEAIEFVTRLDIRACVAMEGEAEP